MRSLSTIEWDTFQREVDVDSLDLPQWGGVVEWRGMDVLVFEGPAPECSWMDWIQGECLDGEIFLSDITSFQSSSDPRLREWKTHLSPYYDSRSQTWYYRFPEAFTDVLAERAAQVSDAAEESVAAIAETTRKIVKGAGGLAENLGEDWFLYLALGIAALVLFGMGPKKILS